MRQNHLWSDNEPSDEALASQQPFALDTLAPEEWLQWIFIPRMTEMLHNETVPHGFSISPYFEQVWKNEADKSELITLLNAIDRECV